MAASLSTRTTNRRRRHAERRSPRGAGRPAGGTAPWLLGLLLALLVTAPAWLPWTSPDLSLLSEEAKGTDDAKHHMLRLFLLEWLVAHGSWYPRWAPDLFMGYGYPVFNYYAPGYYFAGLAMRALLRQEVWDAYRSVGVLAAVAGAGGTYALVTGVWGRPLAGVLGAVAVLTGPYVFQTNLFQRGAVPEALALGVLPWLLLAAWLTWRATSPLGRTLWPCLLALAVAALLLTHALVGVLGLLTAGAWVAGLAWLRPQGGAGRRVLLATLIGAGLAAPFWLPATLESDAVQLEIGREGHLDYRAWLLDPAGNGERQRSPENRQTPAGPLDLHLSYPHQHQFIVTLKPGLGQGALLVAALGALLLARRQAGRPGRGSKGGKAVGHGEALLVVPFLAVALVCWALLFRPSEPLWRLVPGLPLLQWPSRLLGPLGVCLAVAGAGGVAALCAAAEARRGAWGRVAGQAAAALFTGGLLLHGLSGQEVPRLADPQRPMDGRMIVQEEKDSFSHIGTTSGGEFTPRDVQIAVYTEGQRRGRSVFERLYPEREWIGGLFQPLEGDLRFLSWRQGPLSLSVRVANDAARPGALGVRQFRFPGWRAWVDGRRVPVGVAPEIPEQQAALGFVVVAVPPGEHTVNLAFGPTPARLAGAALAVLAGFGLTGTVLWGLQRGGLQAGTGAALLVVSVLALSLLVYGAWRTVRPALGRFAVQPAPGLAAGGGVWRAEGLPTTRGGLLVNVAAAARTGQARISSPSGSTLGPDRFVDVRHLTVTDPDAGRGAAATSRREWLYLHPPADVSVDVEIPAGRTVWLHSLLALDPAAWTAPTGDGVRFQALVAPLSSGAGDRPQVVLDRTLNPRATPAQRRWVPVEADLSPWGGQTVRLTLRTLPGDDLSFDWAGWADPVVAVREFARVREPAA